MQAPNDTVWRSGCCWTEETVLGWGWGESEISHLTSSRRTSCCRAWRPPACPQWWGWAPDGVSSGRGSRAAAAKWQLWSPVRWNQTKKQAGVNLQTPESVGRAASSPSKRVQGWESSSGSTGWANFVSETHHFWLPCSTFLALVLSFCCSHYSHLNTTLYCTLAANSWDSPYELKVFLQSHDYLQCFSLKASNYTRTHMEIQRKQKKKVNHILYFNSSK